MNLSPRYLHAAALAIFATLASAQPATRPQADFGGIIAALGGTDPSAREAAQDSLFDLRFEDLAGLRAALVAAGGQSPEVWSAIKPAVLQIAAANEPYPKQADQSFLGVQLDRLPVISGPPGREVAGIRINSRQLGFQANRYLRDGDLITAINGQIIGATDVDFSIRIRSHPPGTLLNLTLLRDGQSREVSFVADHRPDVEDLQLGQAFFIERRNRAEAYWAREFGALVAAP